MVGKSPSILIRFPHLPARQLYRFRHAVGPVSLDRGVVPRLGYIPLTWWTSVRGVKKTCTPLRWDYYTDTSGFGPVDSTEFERGSSRRTSCVHQSADREVHDGPASVGIPRLGKLRISRCPVSPVSTEVLRGNGYFDGKRKEVQES
jgi:hypothetical protein